MSESPPRPDFIAAQLRKPTGGFAAAIAQNMDKTNEFLYDLTIRCMDLRGGERVLEIGFGSGRFMPRLFSHRDGLKVVGVDYSPEMVAMAKSENGELVRSGSLTLEEGSSERLPSADGSFDIVFCNMVIYFWDHPEEHLREVRRVLKPGGTFYTGFRTKESMLQLPFVQYGFTLYEPDEWQYILEKNGFTVIQADHERDPEMEANDRKIRLESVCMAARKQMIWIDSPVPTVDLNWLPCAREALSR